MVDKRQGGGWGSGRQDCSFPARLPFYVVVPPGLQVGKMVARKITKARNAMCCLLIAVGLFTNVQGQTSFSWPVITKENKPWTRWWWMGSAVDSAGLRYNLRLLHEAGFGGVEVTPIYGVDGFEKKALDFLSPQWMGMLDFTITEARILDMGVVMNTGTGWPFGGQQVSMNNAASKVIFQTYSLKKGETLERPVQVKRSRQKPVASLQLLMAYSDKGDKVDLTNKIDSNGKLNWTAPEGRWQLIAVFNGRTFQQVKRAAPGGHGWVMDPFSTKALHDYLLPFKKAFDASHCPVPLAFFCDSYEVSANWTEAFFRQFAQRRGYKLADYLPALLGKENAIYGSVQKDRMERVTADYRRTLADLLLYNFAEQWTDWTHDVGSRTQYQAHGAPGNLLDLYGAADIPEIETYGPFQFAIPGLPVDSLGKEPAKLDPLLLKFASSAAHVTGRKLTSSETFTWLGEHFRVALSQCKPELDELFTSGVNHVFFHGTTYTPKGAPWPGWLFYASVNFSPYNPFWNHIPAFNQYIGRIQSFLQKGEPDNELLLYWPVQDVWAMNTNNMLYRLTVDNTKQWLDPTPFHAVGERLMHSGYGFDYISDRQLQKVHIQNGKLKTGGPAYKMLIIPPCGYMPIATLQRIVELIQSGAKVIFLGSLPSDVPGLNRLEERRKKFAHLKAMLSTELARRGGVSQKKLGKGMVFIGGPLREIMQRTAVKPSGFSQAGLRFIHRKEGEHYVYFIANLQDHAVDQWITLAKNISSVVFYDPYTGNIGRGAVKVKTKDGQEQSKLYLQLKPGQSLILKAYSHKKLSGPSWHYMEPAGRSEVLKGNWTVAFGKGMPLIPKAYTTNKLKSWTTLSDSAKVFAGAVKYTLTFTRPLKKADDWLLRLGEVNYSADVRVNGQNVGRLWAVPFEVRIGEYLKPGKNTLEITVINLAANRIAAYDRKEIKWKKFKNINVVDMQYKPFDASSWDIVPSGLLGPVSLTPLKNIRP